MLRSRILYLVSLTISAYFAYFYSNRPSYAFFYTILAMGLISLTSVLLAPFVLKIDEGAEKTFIFKNEPLIYKASVKKMRFTGFFYPRVSYTFHRNGAIAYEQESEGVYLVRFPYRGVYNIGIKRVYVTDFLGLFKGSLRGKSIHKVTVYPQRIEDFSINHDGAVLSKSASNLNLYSDSYSDIYDVRKYYPSDDYKKIHWKLSAKKNEFIVKNFQASELARTYAYIDTRKLPLKGETKLRFEDMVTAYAAAAVDCCIAEQKPLRLIYGGDASDILEVDSSQVEALNLLAGLEFDKPSFLPETLNGLQDAENVLIFLSHMDELYFNALWSVLRYNLVIYCFYSGDLPVDKDRYFSELKAGGAQVRFCQQNEE